MPELKLVWFFTWWVFWVALEQMDLFADQLKDIVMRPVTCSTPIGMIYSDRWRGKGRKGRGKARFCLCLAAPFRAIFLI